MVNNTTKKISTNTTNKIKTKVIVPTTTKTTSIAPKASSTVKVPVTSTSISKPPVTISASSSQTKQITTTIVSKKKQIGFFSIIVINVCTCIGVGIFFKNAGILALNNHNFVLSFLPWLIAAIGVIAICMTLGELVNGNRKYANLGYIGWVRTFNGERFYRCARNYMVFVYMVCFFFALPYYFVMAVQWTINSTGASFNMPSWAVFVIAFIILVYFLIITNLSNKMASIHSWVSLIIKFIPVLFVIFGGFILFGINGASKLGSESSGGGDSSFVPFNSLVPGFGVFAAIPSIFFAFDGFYASAGVETNLKPKKISLALVLSLTVTAVIYFLLSLTFLITTNNGALTDYNSFSSQPGWKYFTTFLFVTLAIALLGVLNGEAVCIASILDDLYKKNELPFINKIDNRFIFKNPKTKVCYYSLIYYLSTFLLASAIGCFYFCNSSEFGDQDIANRIISLADLLTSWMSLFLFLFIALAIFGALQNRKTNKIQIDNDVKSKYFKVGAYIGISILLISYVYLTIACFYDVIYFSWYYTNKDSSNTFLYGNLIPQIIMLLIYFVFIVICTFPLWFNNKTKKV